ncbi:MAG TPA: pyrroline-5-carboxylate reductase [Acidimicrobiales bacterium]|nr:pyrroline-5-carboxylate reductase [Acidimicrobiales bacterium]
MQDKLVIVGGGRMGEALAGGLAAAGWPPERVAVVEADAERRRALHGAVATVAEAAPVSGAVIAVKPGDVPAACEGLAGSGVERVVSIAAGVTTGDLARWLGGGPAVLRAMPNTAALVRRSATALAAGPGAGPGDVAWAREVLEAVGTVVELPEAALDAVTGLSGSGPAYVFLLAEALIDAGVLVGLARPVARQLAVQTLLGSAHLLAETGGEPVDLRAAVTSPAGTTAAGLRALEQGGLRAAVLDAVAAATSRARQLGGAG